MNEAEIIAYANRMPKPLEWVAANYAALQVTAAEDHAKLIAARAAVANARHILDRADHVVTPIFEGGNHVGNTLKGVLIPDGLHFVLTSELKTIEDAMKSTEVIARGKLTGALFHGHATELLITPVASFEFQGGDTVYVVRRIP